MKTLQGRTDGKTIAYSTNGSSTHSIVLAFIKEFDLKAKPTATGNPARNAHRRDVRPGRCRLGLAAVRLQGDRGRRDPHRREGDRCAARCAGRPSAWSIANADTLGRSARRCIARFMTAYRETIDYMYSATRR